MVAQDEEPKRLKDATIGDRVTKGVAFGGELWLLGSSGGLISLNLTNDAKRVRYESGVVDIEKVGSELWILRQPSTDANTLSVSVLSNSSSKDLPPFVMSNEDGVIALLNNAGVPAVLSSRNIRIFSADHNRWRAVALKGKLRWWVQLAAASPKTGNSVYVGFNQGEWGGGLLRVNISTGAVANIERRDSKSLCAGPLNRDCDPVTGVIADPQNSDCVLISIGLDHLGMSSGGILRVCGKKVTPLWKKSEMVEIFGGDKEEMSEAVYGLAPGADGGLWAVTERALYQLSADVKSRKDVELPALREVSGIYLSTAVPGAIVVRTDVNWAVSTSGYTPLIVPVEPQK